MTSPDKNKDLQTPARDDAATAVAAAVQERAGLLHAHSEALKILPVKTIMSLMHVAAADRDMPWLHALAAAGYYDVTPSPQVFKVSEAFREARSLSSDQGDPRIASLADLMLKSKPENYSFDVYSGDPIAKAPGALGNQLKLLSVNPTNELFEFFQARVQAFVKQAELVEEPSSRLPHKDDTPQALSFFQTMKLKTSAILMGMAAAMNDPVSIKALARISPNAHKILLEAKFMGQRTLPNNSQTERITPVGVAMLYGSRHALEALIDLGWLPQDAVCMRSFEASGPEPKPSQFFNALQWTKINCDQNGLFTFPSVIERIIEEGIKRPLPKQDSSLENLPLLVMKNEKLGALLPALDRTGVLKNNPNDLILTAIDNRNWGAVGTVFPHIEWQKISHQLEHLVSHAAHYGVLFTIMGNFPPTALSNKLRVAGSGLIDDDAAVAKMLQACIDTGSGSLLAFSGTANSPLRIMAMNHLPRSMLLCLEQGADYNVEFTDKFSARSSFTAEQLAYEYETTEKVMRSFIALKEANQAVRDIRLSLA